MAEHEPPPSTSSKREAPAVPSPQPSAESDRGRRARRKAQIREKTAEEARRRRKVQVEEVGGRSEVVNQLDHTGETRQDAPAKKWDAETRASQGGILPTTKPEPIPPKLVQDLTRIGAQVAKVHSAALQRFQKILDGLTGKRYESSEDNKELARKVNHLARQLDAQLFAGDEPAYYRWQSGVFEARTLTSARELLDSGAGFLPLTVRPKAVSLPEKKPNDAPETQPGFSHRTGKTGSGGPAR